MNQPSQLLRRARQQRNRNLPDPRGFRPPAPAPAPAAIPSQSAPVPPTTPVPPPTPVPTLPEAPTAAVPPAPAPVAQRPNRPSGHALYSEIMRSHDRMGTRHL